MIYKYWEDHENSDDLYNDKQKRKEVCNVTCDCGCEDLKVNALPAPYTGGFIKLTCSKCGKNDILLDDYS